MPNTITRTMGNGSTTIFTVPCPYIDKAHIKVYRDGVLQTLTTHYTWSDSTHIQMVTAPGPGNEITRQRVTPVTPIVTFGPGALDNDDLDLGDLQSRYLAEEASDYAIDIAALTEDGITAAQAAAAEAAASAALVSESLTINAIDNFVSAGKPNLTALLPVSHGTSDKRRLRSIWKKSTAIGTVQPWHHVDASGQRWELEDHIGFPHMFADNVNGGGDDTTPIMKAMDFLNYGSASGVKAGTLLLPGGNYLIGNCELQGIPSSFMLRQFRILGHGARIRGYLGGPNGGKLMGISQMGAGVGIQLEVEGLTFDMLNGTTPLATLALQIKGVPRVSLRRNSFSMGSGPAGSQPLRIIQDDITDQNTGSFWCRLFDNSFRRDGANYVNCVVLQGAQNALLVLGNDFAGGSGGTAFTMRSNAGGGVDYVANGVKILANDFEACTYGILGEIPDGKRIFGLMADFNRFESVNTAFYFKPRTPGDLIAAAQDGPVRIGKNNVFLNVTTVLADTTSGMKIDFQALNNSGTFEATIPNGSTFVNVTLNVTEFNARYNVRPHAPSTGEYIGVTNQTTTGLRLNRAGTSGDLLVRCRMEANQ